MRCDKLFEIIDSQSARYVDVWREFSLLESPTADKVRVAAAGKYLADIARNLGFSVCAFSQGDAADMYCITMNAESDMAPIVFSGHIDTVHPVGSFGTPSVKIEDGKIYGPGVMDCKGGTVAALAAMHALRDVGFTSRPVKLILQTDEETNSLQSAKNTVRTMIEQSRGAVAFLNCESIKDNTLVLRRKGILQFEFEVRGKAIHSSRAPEGVSAIAEAAHKIIELEKLKNIDGLTCNCGMISGGTAKNTVAEECRFTADIRFSTNDELENARRIVEEIARHSYTGADCTFSETSLRPAMVKTEANFALLDRINEINAENALPRLEARMSLGGSDAAYTTEAGIPTVDSIGVSGDFIHTRREYGIVASLAEATKRLAAIAYCI